MKMYFEKDLVYFKKRDGGKILLDVCGNCSLGFIRLYKNDVINYYFNGLQAYSINQMNRIFRRSWKR